MNSALTSISLKKDAAGQVYHATVPEKVRRALALFIGETVDSRKILEATDISIDGAAARRIACEQNYSLVFEPVLRFNCLSAMCNIIKGNWSSISS